MWAVIPIVVTFSAPAPTVPVSTALQGTVVTDAPVHRVVGPHNDGADFYGIALGLAAIVVAIALTRLVFRGRRRADGTGHEG
jgi:hypothetical protein